MWYCHIYRHTAKDATAKDATAKDATAKCAMANDATAKPTIGSLRGYACCGCVIGRCAVCSCAVGSRAPGSRVVFFFLRMTKLSVNVNKVATLRNTRAIGIPSVSRAAELCIEAGAHGITVHPRPDQRHIRPGDVHDLAALLQGFPHVEFNVEGNPFPDYMELVRQVRPTQCTLVPDSPDAVTSDHGWDVEKQGDRLKSIIAELRKLGTRVRLFMDADSTQWRRVRELGADRVELYTEPYAAAHARGDGAGVWKAFASAAKKAQDAGLGVNAGHDLNLENLGEFCRIPGILEVSIGHALIADALEMGLPAAVRAYLQVLKDGARN
jgi:pyridoxine 5-phosphate synthase